MTSQTLHLEALNISRNSIRELLPTTFKGLSELTSLDASHNQLASLPDRMLKDQVTNHE